jgi:Zn-dependent M28 family amino/carboxypeptidase
LKSHVGKISQTFYPRDWKHLDNLNKCADYIALHFENAGAIVELQGFTVQGSQYRNVIGRFGVGQGTKIIIGAHYDAYGELPGADDNASGVAVLIELAYLLGQNALNKEIELVGYVLEEPPFFRTGSMGSAIHAKSIADQSIAGVIVLEMVGYFKDERGSQKYPSILLQLFYPNRGNFIAVVGPWDQGDWVQKVKAGMKGATRLPVYSIRAPTIVPGIDFSDHLNYWPYGFNALMITDTAFYRSKAYHTHEDKMNQLDYKRMSDVVVAVFESILDI